MDINFLSIFYIWHSKCVLVHMVSAYSRTSEHMKLDKKNYIDMTLQVSKGTSSRSKKDCTEFSRLHSMKVVLSSIRLIYASSPLRYFYLKFKRSRYI